MESKEDQVGVGRHVVGGEAVAVRRLVGLGWVNFATPINFIIHPTSRPHQEPATAVRLYPSHHRCPTINQFVMNVLSPCG